MAAIEQILTAAQMRAAEQELIDAGETVESLMELAGQGAAEYVWRIAAGRAVTVLCGPGNNGGDGYVIARVLHERGLAVKVVATFEPTTEAAQNARAAFGGPVVTAAEAISGSVFVDCLFGSGLSRPLSEELATQLNLLRKTHELACAIDLPSGINTDTGKALNDDLPEFDLTIALGAWKRAHFLMPAMAKMGARRLVDIGCKEVTGAPAPISRPSLKAPQRLDHKYSRGLAAIIGGEMSGAALLAAGAAQHSGAGYVKLLSEHALSSPPDLVVEAGALNDSLSDPRITATLIGPGLGRSYTAKERLAAVLGRLGATVLDADALVLLRPELLAEDHSAILATPHEGELANMESSFGLCGDGSKLERALALAKASGMTILAKGPDTVIASPTGQVAMSPPSSSWLSTAGTGDVLAGIAVGRMATGADPFNAACEAVWLHAESARIAGPAFAASGLIGALPSAFRHCL